MFEYCDLIYIIPKFELETNEVYFIRGSWIARKRPLTNKELKYWVEKSKFLYNIILYNCTYSDFQINDILTVEQVKVLTNSP
jgi:hypothetical protein